MGEETLGAKWAVPRAGEQQLSSSWTGHNLSPPPSGRRSQQSVFPPSSSVRPPANSEAVFWSAVINGVMTIVFGIVLLVAIGSIEDVLMASTPILSILMNITGSLTATNAMISGLLLVGFCCVLAQVANLSRLTWAWARDGGLPVHFAYVSLPRTSLSITKTTPTHA